MDSLTILLAATQKNTFVVNEAAITPQEIFLKNTSYTLSQNIPNPFSNTTTIKYSLPTTSTQATIALLNLNGTMLQQFTKLSGSGQITINAQQLPAGIYLYSLLDNGQEIITKRLVVSK